MSPAKRRSTPKPAESAAWWTVGGPCALVIAMLLLGAVLRSPTSEGGSAVPPNSARHERVDIPARAAADAERLARHRDGWTLQFMVACEPRTLDPLVAALEEQPSFYLLRHPEFGGGCYRICWGLYRSKQEAQHPRAYPDELRDIPWPLPVRDALP